MVRHCFEASLLKALQRTNQHLNRLEQRKQRYRQKMQFDHLSIRRARTRTLIQLGGLLEKVGLLDDFHIVLGADLQKDLEMKEPMAALVGALLELKILLKVEPFQKAVLAEKG